MPRIFSQYSAFRYFNFWYSAEFWILKIKIPITKLWGKIDQSTLPTGASVFSPKYLKLGSVIKQSLFVACLVSTNSCLIFNYKLLHAFHCLNALRTLPPYDTSIYIYNTIYQLHYNNPVSNFKSSQI